jgi:hypothetical protein
MRVLDPAYLSSVDQEFGSGNQDFEGVSNYRAIGVETLIYLLIVFL